MFLYPASTSSSTIKLISRNYDSLQHIYATVAERYEILVRWVETSEEIELRIPFGDAFESSPFIHFALSTDLSVAGLLIALTRQIFLRCQPKLLAHGVMYTRSMTSATTHAQTRLCK